VAGNAEAPGDAPGQPSEEEIRRLEEEMRKVRVEDVLLQSVASMINLSARRIAKEDERDLGQAKVGIDAVRAVVDLLEPGPAAQVREALAELQLLYAKHAGEGSGPGGEGQEPGDQGGGADTPGSSEAGGEQAESAGEERKRAEARARLWTPPGA
jgi:hypothetical protein